MWADANRMKRKNDWNDRVFYCPVVTLLSEYSGRGVRGKSKWHSPKQEEEKEEETQTVCVCVYVCTGIDNHRSYHQAKKPVWSLVKPNRRFRFLQLLPHLLCKAAA